MDIIIQIVSLDIYNNSWFSPYENFFFNQKKSNMFNPNDNSNQFNKFSPFYNPQINDYIKLILLIYIKEMQ